MKFIQQLNQLDRLDALIRRKATGRPRDLARRLAVSERTVYNLVELLRVLGAEIDFCHTRGSYYYKNEIQFRFDLVVKGSGENKVRGGNKKSKENWLTAKFLQAISAPLYGSYSQGE